jgi:thiol-disulfide isomerase/thioredoxin
MLQRNGSINTIMVWVLLSFALCGKVEAWVTPAMPTATMKHPTILQTTGAFSSFQTQTTSTLYGMRQSILYDGGEWKSLAPCCSSSNAGTFGRMTVVTGSYQSQAVVAMECSSSMQEPSEVAPTSRLDSGETVYTESIAVLPPKVTEVTAVACMMQALPWHCVMPSESNTHYFDVSNIGGSGSAASYDSTRPPLVVVLGGHERAQQSAHALAVLGANVTLVTTDQGLQKKASTNPQSPFTVSPPGCGEMEIGFAETLGHFDALLDTLDNERNSDNRRESTVMRLLRERHGCHLYVSTQSQAQQVIAEAGVVWGPGQAQSRIQQLIQQASSSSSTFAPPRGFGKTVETLLQSSALNFRPLSSKNGPYVRSWTLPEFMESTLWPRDSNGAASVRFGLPVIDDLTLILDQDERDGSGNMVAAPPGVTKRFVDRDEDGEDDDDDDEAKTLSGPILQVVGIRGLQEDIINAEKDCILFLSAPFCKTCRKLKPRYLQMARANTDRPIVFAQADASGQVGKALGRALGIDAVPAFLFFRQGDRWGKPLGITRLPSPKLELAIDYLLKGLAWDESKFAESKEDTPKKRKRSM